MTPEETIILVIALIIFIFLGGMFLFEMFGPTETKQISGTLGQRYNMITKEFQPDMTFHSDGGAIYRISNSDILWYMLPDLIFNNDYSIHMTKNVTLRKTYFDKIIVDVEGYTPSKAYVAPKCSDCGGIFVI